MTVASPVVIDGAKVSINAEMGVAGAKCIVGDADVGDERLVVRKADVEITSVLGAVPAIGDVQLDGCHITEPAGAAFDSAMRALVFEGKPVENLSSGLMSTASMTLRPIFLSRAGARSTCRA